MKKKRIFTAIAFTFALVFSLFSPKVVSAAYIDDNAEEALKRINAIRLEAKNENILALKYNTDTYLGQSTDASGSELKWSKSAIEMSKARADECQSQGKISHTRPDGTEAVNIVGTYSLENLAMAWGQKQTMLDAVNSWYEEKEAYLKHINYLNGKTATDTTEQWGHYSTLIGNEFTSVGFGTVYYQGTTQYGVESIIAGEFSNATDYVDQYQEKTEDKTDDKDTTGIHDIFKAKDDSKIERYKERIFNKLLYCESEINVSDIDIHESEISYVNTAGTQLSGSYATRWLILENPFMNGVAITGSPEFTYKDNGNVKTVKFTLHPAWKEELIKKAIASYVKQFR